MRTRIIAGLLLVPLLILIIVGGTPLYIGEAIIISIALHEFYKAFEAKDIKPLYYIGYIFSIYLLIKNYLKLPITFTYTLIFILFLISIISILNLKRNIIDIVVTFFGLFYVGVLIDFIILTMYSFSKGHIYVWLIFIIATLVCLGFGYYFNLNLTMIILLGFFGSIIAQMGDLFASSIKRYVGIKDYGKETI